jgi:hypothetical protein
MAGEKNVANPRDRGQFSRGEAALIALLPHLIGLEWGQPALLPSCLALQILTELFVEAN